MKKSIVPVLAAFACLFAASQGLFAEEEKKERPPDKIEFVKLPDGREVIKITGQNTASAVPSPATPATGASTGQRAVPGVSPSVRAEERYAWTSLPVVRPVITQASRDGASWYTVTTDNFSIEIEENEAFGVKTAEMLEGFALFLREQMKVPEDKVSHKLKLEIFKGRAGYEKFCKENKMDCDATQGITRMVFAGRSAQYGGFRENKISFYWDADWRKLWNERQSAYLRENFYTVLFHEATHQVVHAYIPKIFPRWLDEGLAGYFEAARFDGKEIYLPVAIGVPYAKEMKAFLKKGKKPLEVFFWNEQAGENELAFYGFSASFIAFLMRDAPHRSCLDALIKRLSGGLPAEQLFDDVLSNKEAGFWKAWILFYQTLLASAR